MTDTIASTQDASATRRAVRVWIAAAGLSAFASLATPGQAAGPTPEPSPVGRWVTYSDVTHKPSGVIEIKLDQGALKGTVLQLLNRPPTAPPAICEGCAGQQKNMPMVGMTILWGLTNDGSGVWDNGSILDPDSGDVYSANVRLEDGGRKLLVRGYFGISLIGRSQEWVRQN